MLTRELILSGKYLQCFDDIPDEIRWTPEQIEQSMLETLRTKPRDRDLWIFGYGSLMWNPLFEVDERRVATMHGWHRSFCLRTIAGRARSDRPGRMLSLEAGGFTSGIALKLPDAKRDEDLRVIWIREMVNGAYIPIWAPITFEDDTHETALVFVANPNHVWHDTRADIPHVASLVATASGPLGTNADYVRQLSSTLKAHNLEDHYVEGLVEELDRIATCLSFT